MVQAIFNLASPDSVVCDLGARMTLADWKQVRKALQENIQTAASIQFIHVINDLVKMAEQKFEAKNRVDDIGNITTEDEQCESNQENQ